MERRAWACRVPGATVVRMATALQLPMRISAWNEGFCVTPYMGARVLATGFIRHDPVRLRIGGSRPDTLTIAPALRYDLALAFSGAWRCLRPHDRHSGQSGRRYALRNSERPALASGKGDGPPAGSESLGAPVQLRLGFCPRPRMKRKPENAEHAPNGEGPRVVLTAPAVI